MLPSTKFTVGDKVKLAPNIKWVRTFTENGSYTRIPASTLKGCVGRVDHTYGSNITGRYCYAVNFTKLDRGRTTPLYLKFYSYQLELVEYGKDRAKLIEEHDKQLAQKILLAQENKKKVADHLKPHPWVRQTKVTIPEQSEPQKTLEVSLSEARGWWRLGGKLKEIALKLFPATQLNPEPVKKAQVGDEVTVAGRKAFVLELNEHGRPIAWISRIDCTNFMKEGHNWCSMRFARDFALYNGWHIPAQREIEYYQGTILQCIHESIFWTAEKINGNVEPHSWCWWGDSNKGEGYERRPMIVMRYA